MTQYAHRIWGQEEGLVQPTVYSILQTRDGFLWLGTQDSLIHFDGIHFREFAEGASVLHGTLVRALAEDKRGNLWAGSLGSGVVRIGPNGAVEHYSTHNRLPSDTVFCLVADHEGTVWACTTAGLVRFDQDRIRVFTKADGLLSNRIRATCEAADGSMWVAAVDSGLSRFTGSRFVSIADSKVRGRSVSTLACAADGGIWAGTADGLLHIKGESSRLYTTRDGLPDNEVSALTESSDGTVWIGTNNGISRLRHDEISVYRTRDGLSHSELLAFCLDREGTLWAGTKNGLDQFTNAKVTPFTTNEGLLSNDTGPVLEDKSGQLWIGTLGRGLNSFDGQQFRTLTAANGLSDNTVLSLALDPSGDIWVGTKRGFDRVRNGKVAAAFGEKDGLRGTEVRSISVDSQDRLCVGTENGLQVFNEHNFVRDVPVLDTGKRGILALTEASGGLIASAEGPWLYRFRAGAVTPYALDLTHSVDAFWFNASSDSIWMATLGSGLLRMKNGSFTHVYVKDGLYDSRIYSILQDDNSNLWFGSSKGVFRVSQRDLEDFADGKIRSVKSLPFSTGQLRFECRSGVQPAACRTRDGRLWFSTESGLVVIDPNRLQNNRVAPLVKITALLASGERMPLTAVNHLKPRETNNIEIRYAGLSFISPEKVSFRYRLEGYDKSWVEVGARREAFYTNLPHGDFRFRVEARNSDGVRSSNDDLLSFSVEPRFYERRWFYPLLALCVMGAALGGFGLRIRRLKHRFQLVLGERNRIARELHDTLLQGLAGITMQMQALWTRLPPSQERRTLGSIIEDAGKCATEARQSLWGLRTGRRDALDFSDQLVSLAREATSEKDVRLMLDVSPVALPNVPELEHALLGIAKEAISNSLKQAGAAQLAVSLRQTDGLLLLVIEDNGPGPGSSHWRAVPGHFGLEGMKERADEIGAELEIIDAASGGTRVSLLWPLPKSKRESNREAVDSHQIQ